MLSHLLRHARSMPPQVLAAKAARFGLRAVRRVGQGWLQRRRCSYAEGEAAGGPPGRLLRPLDRAALQPWRKALELACAQTLAHRFDLLGSGPVELAHGTVHAGFGPHRYGPGPALGEDWRQRIADFHHGANRAPSLRRLQAITDPAYRPIDWQVDFRSGYRWSVRCWGPASPFAHRPGVDIKLPWELARLQHLPQLALFHRLEPDPRLIAEFRHQVLDFLGANPPGWGVNWACAMDVAIRAANILLARDLFQCAGVRFDQAFDEVLAGAMLDHGRHIVRHLEWSETHRGNHYLANLIGLIFIGAYLPDGDEADCWLAYGTGALGAEILRQFLPDGGNFEASTAYHRLSAEMALFAVALVSGLPRHRRAALGRVQAYQWRGPGPFVPPPSAAEPFTPEMLERLERAVRFAADATKPSGLAVQVGDNDSGRLFKLAGDERPLDFSALARAGAALFGPLPPVPGPDGLVVAALAGAPLTVVQTPLAARPAKLLPDGVSPSARRVVVAPADDKVFNGLRLCSYPDFGLHVWKNARCFVSVRCGPIGQNGQGGHAHNDQLAVEIEIDGVPWVRDPGTHVYTSDLDERNRYRSALAHFVPRHGRDEPARLLAPFSLEDRARAVTLTVSVRGFLGVHSGFGTATFRRLTFTGGTLVIEDMTDGPVIARRTALDSHTVREPDALPRLWGLNLPFSPGYGLRE